ncbi:MAG: di-heme oxidoredictase family protein, partial [Alphaproteobacteria bacterium]
SMILKLGQPERLGQPSQQAAPDPVYGVQLQDFAVPGARAEGHIGVTYKPKQIVLPDHTIVTLRQPKFFAGQPAYGPLRPSTQISARIAPQMIGLGLLARIPQDAITALADPDDKDGDGISGRVNWLATAGATPALGRFGWKAGKANLGQQISAALSLDMGLGNPAHPAVAGDCTQRQLACRALPSGASPDFENLEAHSVLLDWLVHYSANLAVPARRTDAAATGGAKIFAALGCAACHQPTFTTRPDPGQKHLGGRMITPYTDLLLHDMGAGLADELTEDAATGQEWRTAPLWGIGLSAQVNGNGVFLHDGRAGSLTQAILWHGGEAAKSRKAFTRLAHAERAALLAFLNTL